jgi:hypothetical protein
MMDEHEPVAAEPEVGLAAPEAPPPKPQGAQVVLTGDAQAAARGELHGEIHKNVAARDAAMGVAPEAEPEPVPEPDPEPPAHDSPIED